MERRHPATSPAVFAARQRGAERSARTRLVSLQGPAGNGRPRPGPPNIDIDAADDFDGDFDADDFDADGSADFDDDGTDGGWDPPRGKAPHTDLPHTDLPGIPLSEAVAAHHALLRPERPLWLRALADRVPMTLRGRWGLEARAAVALAVLAMAAALLGGWYLWQAQPTVVDLPGAPAATAGMAEQAAAVVPDESTPLLPQPQRLPLPQARASTSPSWITSTPPSAASTSTAGPVVVVDVEGKVPHPGLQTMPAGSRIDDAIRAAGGAAPGLDTTALDLARPLVDGEQLRIGLIGAAAPAPDTAAGPATGSRTKRARTGQPLNLNAATAEQLQTVPDIGPAMAQRILDWRTAHGRFESVSQLRQVRGIGDPTPSR